MKHYAVYIYAYDINKEEYTDVKGQIQAFVQAEDAWEACEKAGLTDPTKYFADAIHPDHFKEIQEEIKKEKATLDKLDAQMGEWITEQKEKEKLCPSCGKELDKKGECKACGFGVDEIAIDGQVVTKEMIEKFEKEMKKQLKKASKKPIGTPTTLSNGAVVTPMSEEEVKKLLPGHFANKVKKAKIK